MSDGEPAPASGPGPGAGERERTSGDRAVGVAEVARRFRAGQASGEELSWAFVASTLFCPIADRGVQTITALGRRLVPLYSSERALAIGEGPCEWFSGTGADLVTLVPDGCGIVLDRGSDSEIGLEAWALRRLGATDALEPGEGEPTEVGPASQDEMH